MPFGWQEIVLIHNSVGGHEFVKGQPKAVWQVPVKAPQFVSASAKLESVPNVPPLISVTERLDTTFLFSFNPLCFKLFFFMILNFIKLIPQGTPI